MGIEVMDDPQHLADRVGLPAAPAYWPALVRGAAADAPGSLAAAARRWDPASLVADLGRECQLVLLADGRPLGATRGALRDAAAGLLGAAAAGEARAVVGERIGPAEPLGPVAAKLWRAGEAGAFASRDRVTWARHDALARLLDSVDARSAARFVDVPLAALAAHDRRHGTCLQRVLELALDHEDRNRAASAAFMHRNTFRRHLRQALALVDADLACPQERLALHLALKLRGEGEVGASCTASLGLEPAEVQPPPR